MRWFAVLVPITPRIFKDADEQVIADILFMIPVTAIVIDVAFRFRPAFARGNLAEFFLVTLIVVMASRVSEIFSPALAVLAIMTPESAFIVAFARIAGYSVALSASQTL